MLSLFAMFGVVVGLSSHRTRESLSSFSWNLKRCIAIALLGSSLVTVLGIRQWRSQQYYSQASLFTRDSRYSEALAALNLADRNTPCDALYTSSRGLLLERSLENNIDARALMGKSGTLLADDRDRLLDAAAAYRRSLSCSPMDSMLHHNLAWILTMLGEDHEARDQITEALRLEPTSSLYHVSSGLLYERSEQLQAAADEYSTAVAIAPRLLTSPFFVEFARRRPGESSRLIEHSLRLLTALKDSPYKDAEVASILNYEGETSIASIDVQRALDRLPSLSYAWLTLGVLDQKQGKIEKAAGDYERALFVDARNRVALAYLASTDLVLGQEDIALRAANRAIMTRRCGSIRAP
jgi:tetratricopeptide (TPR) repeat protein